MTKIFLICMCLLPAFSFAQDASNMIPKKSAVKDTSRQIDLIDVAKGLFHINPKKPRIQREKKIYFSFLPIPGAVPGGDGRALITSTTAGTYLGPQSTTNLPAQILRPTGTCTAGLVYHCVPAFGSRITPGTFRGISGSCGIRNIPGA